MFSVGAVALELSLPPEEFNSLWVHAYSACTAVHSMCDVLAFETAIRASMATVYDKIYRKFPIEVAAFIAKCLNLVASNRASVADLLVDEWMIKAEQLERTQNRSLWGEDGDLDFMRIMQSDRWADYQVADAIDGGGVAEKFQEPSVNSLVKMNQCRVTFNDACETGSGSVSGSERERERERPPATTNEGKGRSVVSHKRTSTFGVAVAKSNAAALGQGGGQDEGGASTLPPLPITDRRKGSSLSSWYTEQDDFGSDINTHKGQTTCNYSNTPTTALHNKRISFPSSRIKDHALFERARKPVISASCQHHDIPEFSSESSVEVTSETPVQSSSMAGEGVWGV